MTRRRMQAQKSRDTKPELALRRILHGRGLRYLVDRAPLPGLRRRADIVFTREKVAVFVDGCFWHSCPQHGSTPHTNTEWWVEKLERNRKRDADTNQRLEAAGWLPVRSWEHEEPESVATRVESLVRARRATT